MYVNFVYDLHDRLVREPLNHERYRTGIYDIAQNLVVGGEGHCSPVHRTPGVPFLAIKRSVRGAQIQRFMDVANNFWISDVCCDGIVCRATATTNVLYRIDSGT